MLANRVVEHLFPYVVHLLFLVLLHDGQDREVQFGRNFAASMRTGGLGAAYWDDFGFGSSPLSTMYCTTDWRRPTRQSHDRRNVARRIETVRRVAASFSSCASPNHT
uniref:Putative secreted peptide n=1 Tax=Anopheles braziliensis TaxID=58242 RepID=A0A2M3ZT67_9DIPT